MAFLIKPAILALLAWGTYKLLPEGWSRFTAWFLLLFYFIHFYVSSVIGYFLLGGGVKALRAVQSMSEEERIAHADHTTSCAWRLATAVAVIAAILYFVFQR